MTNEIEVSIEVSLERKIKRVFKDNDIKGKNLYEIVSMIANSECKDIEEKKASSVLKHSLNRIRIVPSSLSYKKSNESREYFPTGPAEPAEKCTIQSKEGSKIILGVNYGGCMIG